MRILFTIESLHFGGKERRLTEFLLAIENENIEYMVLTIKPVIEFSLPLSITKRVLNIPRRFGKKDPSLFYKFFKTIKQFNPDIIHSWGNMTSIYSLPSALLLNKLFVTSEITDAPEKIPFRILSYRLVFPFCNLIISNSKAGLEAYNVPKERATVIYNGFNFSRIITLMDRQTMKEKLGINSSIVVTMIANFSARKDYESFIKSAVLIISENALLDICFLCVGGGDSSYEKSLIPYELRDRILFLGPRSDTDTIISITDVGVLSTYTEGISNSILEFMANGIPVVATDGGGTKEIITDNVNGFLVYKRNVKQLAEKILLLVNNSQIRSEFGRNAKNKIELDFSIDRMKYETLKVYNKLKK